MGLNRRRQVKKDEDVLSKVPRSKEKFRGTENRGEEGDKNKFSHNIHQVNYDR